MRRQEKSLGDNTEGEQAWHRKGLCFNHPQPDLWFPTNRSSQEDVEHAKALCRVCPVMLICRDYARRYKIGYGIWGGEDATER